MKSVQKNFEELNQQIKKCPACASLNPDEPGGPFLRNASPSKPDTACESGNARSARECPPGRVTANPFFNFIREVRTQMCGQSQTAIAVEAARRWNSMSCEEKSRYRQQAQSQIRRQNHH